MIDYQQDKMLPRSVLSTYELRCLPYAISSYLHHCSGVPANGCGDGANSACAMCVNAVRLVIQAAEPKIIEEVISRAATSVGLNRVDLQPEAYG